MIFVFLLILINFAILSSLEFNIENDIQDIGNNISEEVHEAYISVSNALVKQENGVTTISLKDNGKFVFKGTEFNLKIDKETKFVFDNDPDNLWGEYEQETGRWKGVFFTKGTQFVVGKNGGEFFIRGHDLNLPEDTKVEIVEDNKVKITYPGEIKIPDIEKAKYTSYEIPESVFEFYSEKGLKLDDNEIYNGNIIIKNNEMYTTSENSKLGGLEIHNPNEQEIRLDFKGKIDDNYKGAYISKNREGVLIIGKNTAGAGPAVKFNFKNNFLKDMKERQYVVMQAGKDANNAGDAGTGTIKIINRGEYVPKVETYGDFVIDVGNRYFRTFVEDGKTNLGTNDPGKSGNLINFPSIEDNEEKDKYYPMEIQPYDEEKGWLTKIKDIQINGKDANVGLILLLSPRQLIGNQWSAERRVIQGEEVNAIKKTKGEWVIDEKGSLPKKINDYNEGVLNSNTRVFRNIKINSP